VGFLLVGERRERRALYKALLMEFDLTLRGLQIPDQFSKGPGLFSKGPGLSALAIT